MKKSFNTAFFAPLFVAIGMSAIIAAGRTFLRPYLHFEHWGVFPIEQMSDIFWVVLFGVIFYYRKIFPCKADMICTAFLSFIMFMRELGVHHMMTKTDSTPFKIHFFTNPNNPLHEKIVSATIIVLILAAALYLLGKYFVKMVKGFFKLSPLCWTMATFGCWGIVCKAADRIPSLYAKRTGVSFAQDTIDFYSLVEEAGEMFLPLLIMLAIWQLAQAQAKKS